MPSPLPRVGAVQLRARAGEGARMERGAGVEAAQLRGAGRGRRGCPPVEGTPFEGGEGAVVELRARYLPLSLRCAGVEAVEHVEADLVTCARCAGRALGEVASWSAGAGCRGRGRGDRGNGAATAQRWSTSRAGQSSRLTIP